MTGSVIVDSPRPDGGRPRTIAGYGACSQCDCPEFEGSSWTCVRGGCDHHYDEHW